MSKFQDSLNSIITLPIFVLSKLRLPKINGVIKVNGLISQTEVYRDTWGIPHIVAQNPEDLFFTQGFTHAQDRFWQMEFNRRFVAGRLSEIFGKVTVSLDRWLRTLRMYDTAVQEATFLNGKTLDYLKAYADGVNYFVKKSRLPIEFLLLRYRPEPWKIEDTLSWIKMMSWSLSINWETELIRAKLIDQLGNDLASELEPPHLLRWPFTIPPGTDFSHVNTKIKEGQQNQDFHTHFSPKGGVGSNCWAVSGSITEGGFPILANDMHLQLSIPAIWYENHLIEKDTNVTGVTFPGIPGIVAGHNGKIAWGFTNGFADVQDLFIEHLKEDQNGNLLVEHNGDWEKAKVINEKIVIRGQQSEIEKVIITRHGPIINNLSPDLTGENYLALKWTSLDPDHTMVEGLFDMMSSEDCQEFHQALRKWTAPVQNIVYADTKGNIGYTYAGRIPIRARGNGKIPVPGWTETYDWSGYIPFEQLPHLNNPPQDYIVSANNRPIPDDYPVRIDMEPITGDRAQRIAELIIKIQNDHEKIGIVDTVNMHYDQKSPTASDFSHYVGSVPIQKNDVGSILEEVINLFRNWDGVLSMDSTSALIYQYLVRNIISLILKNKLQENGLQNPKVNGKLRKEDELINQVMGKGPTPIIAETSLYGEHLLPWLLHQMENPQSHWFNLGKGETRDTIIIQAINKTIQELQRNFGSEMRNWSWGSVHQLFFKHVLSASSFLGNLFDRGPYPIGGDHTTIWAAGTYYHTIKDSPMIGPPFRMIIDLGHLSSSIGVLIPGQSGNPSSLHYDDQIDSWFKRDYHPLLYNLEEIKKQTKNYLKLTPLV